MNPWDIPAPNADDPSPRIIRFGPARVRRQGATPRPASDTSVPPIPADDLRAIFEPRTRRAIEARLNGEAHIQAMRDRLNGKARHRVIPDLTWRDDLLDLWDDIRSQPLSHAVVGVFGFIAGTFGILALAEIWVRLS